MSLKNKRGSMLKIIRDVAVSGSTCTRTLKEKYLQSSKVLQVFDLGNRRSGTRAGAGGQRKNIVTARYIPKAQKHRLRKYCAVKQNAWATYRILFSKITVVSSPSYVYNKAIHQVLLFLSLRIYTNLQFAYFKTDSPRTEVTPNHPRLHKAARNYFPSASVI